MSYYQILLKAKIEAKDIEEARQFSKEMFIYEELPSYCRIISVEEY